MDVHSVDNQATLDLQPNVVSPLDVPANNATNSTLVIGHDYKTTVARSDVLEDTHELREFDNLRYRLKNSISMAKTIVQHYKKLSTVFENKVLEQYKKNSQKHIISVCKKLLVHEWKHQL